MASQFTPAALAASAAAAAVATAAEIADRIDARTYLPPAQEVQVLADINDRFRFFHTDNNEIIRDVPWTLVKRLGGGSFGNVFHFRANKARRAGTRQGAKFWNVAIKIAKEPRTDPLNDEKEIMRQLQSAGFVGGMRHVTRLIGRQLIDPPNAVIDKIFMEYCAGGSLAQLLNKRFVAQEAFFERNLWEFFACLVRGLCTMDHYDECRQELPHPNGEQSTPSWPLPWNPTRRDPNREHGPICHFDLKHDNVLVGDASEHSHPNMNGLPTLKITDFGQARHMHWHNEYDSAERIATNGVVGTRGYFPPEYFNPYKEFLVEMRRRKPAGQARARTMQPNRLFFTEVGNFGTHTNIWQIGCIMYLLVMGNTPRTTNKQAQVMTHKCPPPANGEQPFTAEVYGRKMGRDAVRISKRLKQTIWMCLTKNITERIDLPALYNRVEAGCIAISTGPGAQPAETQADFEKVSPRTGQWPGVWDGN